MNKLKTEKQLMIISALVEGNSVRSIERMTGVHRDTILRLMVRVGERCEALLGQKIRNVPVKDVQLDEIWGYCFKKQKSIRPGDDPNFGDAYTFVAIERHTKLVLNFALGKRDQQTANVFTEGLRLATDRTPYQLTADGFSTYPQVIENTLSDRVDFAQLIGLLWRERPAIAPQRSSARRLSQLSATPILRGFARLISSARTSPCGCKSDG